MKCVVRFIIILLFAVSLATAQDAAIISDGLVSDAGITDFIWADIELTDIDIYFRSDSLVAELTDIGTIETIETDGISFTTAFFDAYCHRQGEAYAMQAYAMQPSMWYFVPATLAVVEDLHWGHDQVILADSDIQCSSCATLTGNGGR